MNLHLDTRKHIDDSIKVKELFAEEVDLLKDLKDDSKLATENNVTKLETLIV